MIDEIDLDNDDADIRYRSARAIGDLGMKTDAVLAQLLRRLPVEADADVKANLIYALDVFNDVRALEALSGVLEDSDVGESLRYRAAYAIARLNDPAIYNALRRYLDDQHLSVRKTALWGLGNSGKAEARELLLSVYEDRREPRVVRYWAARGLSRLGEPVALDVFREEFDAQLIYRGAGADYTLKTDVSQEFLDEVSALLPQLDSLHRTLFKTGTKIKEASTEALLFRSEDDFMDYAEMYYPGFYHSGGGYVPSANLLFTYVRPESPETIIHLLKHEWTHRFVDLYLYKGYWQGDLEGFYRRFPCWFDEGTAEYVSFYDLKAGSAGVPRHHARSLLRKAEKGTLRDIADVVSGEDPYGEGMRYDGAWGLVYFLRHYDNGKYLPLVDDIIEEMKKGSRNINSLFLEGVDAALLQSEFEDFIKGLLPP